MIRDLADASGADTIACDVAVVGAGIAGLILATRLARAGRRVVVLEAGGRNQQDETHPLNAVEQAGIEYSGAEHGRFRCLGGTSTRWGGALIPFADRDYDVQLPGWDADWLGIGSELGAHVAEAEKLFGLEPGTYDDPAVAALPATLGAFVPRSTKWPSFTRRNVAHLLEADIEAPHGPVVVLNAIAERFAFRPDGRLDSIVARSPSRTSLTVTATEFVIAAGAIESTRLLFVLDRAADGRAFAPHDVLGRYFQDHLSAPVLDFDVHDRRRLNRLAGFRFVSGGMRNLRWEPDAALRRAAGLPASFAHIGFETQSGGFDLLRQVLRRIQRRERPSVDLLAQLAGNAPWLTRAVWWRLVERRLLLPDDAKVAFHLVVEQQPNRDSRITLSERPDIYGQPLARIDWQIGECDLARLGATATQLQSAWAASGYADIATLTPRTAIDAAAHGGIYHPTGSARIGRTARHGPLDRDLRAHAVPNLTVTSTAAFPTGGGANPTMTLVLATLRAADRIARLW